MIDRPMRPAAASSRTLLDRKADVGISFEPRMVKGYAAVGFHQGLDICRGRNLPEARVPPLKDSSK